MTGKDIRMNRLFSKGENAVVIAIDHGYMDGPIPVLGLGGHTTPDPADSLQLAADEIADGAKGVVFGRNALQRKDPIAYQLALNEVVKRGMSSQDAVKKFNL